MAGITEKGQKPFIFIAVPQLRNTNGLGFVEKKRISTMIMQIVIIIIIEQKPCLIVETEVSAYRFKLSFFKPSLKVFKSFIF